MPQVERIRIAYADHNSELQRQLPLDADLVENVALENSPLEWWLVKFERPATYAGTPFSYAVVAARFEGQFVRRAEPTSAFVLFNPSRALPANPSVSSFAHSAWCAVKYSGT